MSDGLVTRRRWLAVGGSALASLVAGCSGGSEPTPTPESVFRGTSFEGTDLVVDLREDHGVSTVNLIAPDGSLFAEADVATGATRVGLEILRIRPASAGMIHYVPGAHELVAVSGDETETTTVELVPELRIVDVQQFRDGTRGGDFGRLIVEVENTGTGPTWVHDVTHIGAPNRGANVELGRDPGVILLEQDGLPESAIITPGSSRSFEDIVFPLIFRSDDSASCEDQFTMSVLIGSPVLDPIEQTIQIDVAGEPRTAGLTGQFTCSNVSVEFVGE